MNRLNRSSYTTILAGLLAVGLSINCLALVQAQPTPSSLRTLLPDKLNFEPPQGLGNPNGREGGATRGCSETPEFENILGLEPLVSDSTLDLKPLVPNSGVGTTVAEYPTFFWYLPRTTAVGMEFKLSKVKDNDYREIYSSKLPIAPNQQGIIRLQLPTFATLPPLEINQKYAWQVALICDDDNNLSPNYETAVGGEIVRVKPPSQLSQIDTARLEDRVTIYAKSGLWHETLSTLAELRRLRPANKDIKDAWAKLLKSEGLNEYAAEPMVVQSSAQRNTKLPVLSPQSSSPKRVGEDR